MKKFLETLPRKNFNDGEINEVIRYIEKTDLPTVRLVFKSLPDVADYCNESFWRLYKNELDRIVPVFEQRKKLGIPLSVIHTVLKTGETRSVELLPDFYRALAIDKKLASMIIAQTTQAMADKKREITQSVGDAIEKATKNWPNHRELLVRALEGSAFARLISLIDFDKTVLPDSVIARLFFEEKWPDKMVKAFDNFSLRTCLPRETIRDFVGIFRECLDFQKLTPKEAYEVYGDDIFLALLTWRTIRPTPMPK